MQTQEVLPSARVQMPPIQNNQATEIIENKNIKYFKTTVRGLGFTTILLSVVVFCMSTAEVAIEACRKGGYSDYGGYYDYEAVTHCYPYVSWGAGIWCSVLPFLAGVFGVIAGSKSSSQRKNGLLMGFSTAGAVMSFLLIVIQSSLTVAFRWEVYASTSKYRLQVAIMGTTGLNFILLIISSAYSCCLCKSCCCRQSRKPVEQRVVYVPYNPNQQVNYQPTPGTFNYPQESQTVLVNQQQQLMKNVQPNQQIPGSSPMTCTNPPQYDQLDSKTPL